MKYQLRFKITRHRRYNGAKFSSFIPFN